MKELFSLLIKEPMFKFKVLGLGVVSIIAMLAVFLIPLLLEITGSSVLTIIGWLLILPLVIAVMFMMLKVLINKILPDYYPNIHIENKPLIVIMLGIALINYPLYIIAVIVLMIAVLVAGLINNAVVAILMPFVVIVFLFQYIVFVCSIWYTCLHLIDRNLVSFANVFKFTLKNYKSIRKHISQALLRVVIFSILIYLIVLILLMILMVINTIISITSGSVAIYGIFLMIEMIALYFVIIYLYLVNFQYLVKRYAYIKVLIEKNWVK